MATPLDESELRRLSESWQLAEQRLKRAELVNTTIAIPALNQLRYAGYHILQALSASKKSVEVENVEKAIRHCERATYDAVDAEVMYYLQGIKLFQSDYRDVPVEIPGFDYQAVCRQCRESNNLIDLVKSNQETRSEHYKTIIAHCDALKAALDSVESAREELNKRVRAKKKADATEAKRWKIATVFALISAAAACSKVAYDWKGPSAASPASSAASPASAAQPSPSASHP